MKIALIVLGALLSYAGIGSAIAKFKGVKSVVEAMLHVGVKESQIKLLGILETLGGLGIIAGIWSKPLGIAATIGMVLYFFGAVVAHIRKKDGFKELAAPTAIFLIAVATLVLELKRK